MSQTLDKQYQSQAVEAEVAALWERAGAFHAEVEADKDPYVIVIPPPNVTAALHMGHALNNTIQDILIRWRRMAGDNAVWIPGTDHAGIATQTVVEKRVMQEEGRRRTDFKRDEFVAKIQAWKDEYEERITNQLKLMGCSCDFKRQRFTMDETCARAVREAFFRLFKEGLIYRGKRLVNWDPVTQTALADDEVEMRDVDGHFWYMKYPLVAEGDEKSEIRNPKSEKYVTVATTRPETMLGDTAVAVNPNDPERAHLIGRTVRLPIVNRVIPIVGDDYVVIPDPGSDDAKAKYASGFLKVTPAHDPNDYEIGQRHDLPIINVMAPDGSISDQHGWEDVSDEAKPLVGLAREEAREAIVKWFKDHDLLPEVKPYSHAVGHSYRSHVPVEPYLSDQWYVKVTDDRLAGAALRAMVEDQRSKTDGCVWKDGDSFTNPQSEIPNPKSELRFHPPRYAKTFQHWHENIRDWCISRQLWWGHRIPVWSGGNVSGDRREADWQVIEKWVEDGRLAWTQDRVTMQTYICIRNETDQDAIDKLESLGFVQDPDVLDTWFSSALWPISTLGWPGETPELEAWNPSSTLCTAREIITLWVSRMVMFNQFFRGCLPFTDVFIHAMIQDGHGQKMSKSLGNGVDPLDIIHSHGADAMRFTLASMTTQTQDVKMPVDPVCPHCEQVFEPTAQRTAAGHVVAAATQTCPHCDKPMTTSYGAASGEATPSDQAPLARNTSSKFDNGRNFANKLWNAGRFVLGVLEDVTPGDGGPRALESADRWILSRLGRTLRDVDRALSEYQFAHYAQQVYDFFWRDYCDWYLEAIKPVVREDSEAGQAARATAAACLDAVLRMLHPMMPYITEHMWKQLNSVAGQRGAPGVTLAASELCIVAPWPAAEGVIDGAVEAAFDLSREVVVGIRNVRNQYNVPPRQTLTVSIQAAGDAATTLRDSQTLIQTLAGCAITQVGDDVKPGDDAATAVVGNIEVYIAGLIDAGAERERLTKRRDELSQSIKALEGRLSNKGYVEKAPAHLVQQTRDELDSQTAELKTVESKLASL